MAVMRGYYRTMSAETSRAGEADSSSTANDKDSSVECPTCGRDDFANRLGMKCHHKKIHGESLAHTIDCDWCGETVKRKPAIAEENDHNFCGDECRGEWLSETNTGEDSYSWVGYTTTECKNCGEMFEHRPYIDRTFCDIGCRNDYEHGPESNFWNGGKVTLECVGCGDDFKVFPSREGYRKYCSKECRSREVTKECNWCESSFKVKNSRSDKAKFCSLDCYGSYQSTLPPEEQPAYKGGHAEYYGPNWVENRNKALERDNYTCQYCGTDMSGDGRDPDVHHIKRLKWYQDNYDAPEWWKKGNRLENLISACRPCHNRWEGIPVTPSER